ncbi:MAG TPA: RdgB/HAM1 family non-canonical purine NTP pyrophosphatase [Bacilli bacterium]|nr:RdgB/HAM1 family non-canonical purine NTP pyrophosphatase [Bacilli bacterium]
MKILFATHNNHKVSEIKNMLPEVTIVTLDDVQDEDEIEETGLTFSENAAIKARYYYQKYHLPVIADDSGLVVMALNGEPGVHSARYSPSGSYAANNQLLLEKMANISHREAYFITVICFIDNFGKEHYFTGKITGTITKEEKGTSGFGYDPLFYVPEFRKTFAEMSLAEKNKISHRALALNQFKYYIQNIFQKNR